MIDWAHLLTIANTLLAIAILVVNIILFNQMKIARTLRIMLMAISVYWAVVYGYLAIMHPNFVDLNWFGQVFIRPAITITLAVMLASGLYHWRSRKS